MVTRLAMNQGKLSIKDLMQTLRIYHTICTKNAMRI